MKKILFVLVAVLLTQVYAGEKELVRRYLIVKKSNNPVEIPIKYYDKNLKFGYLVVDDKLVLLIPSRLSKSKKKFFTSLTTSVRWILKNYKFGKVSSKMVIFLLEGDKEKYPFFEISKNNLSLLDNRDFGAKDMTAFNDNGGFVYPLKLILRRGKFISGGNEDINLKKDYSKFLEKFNISPLIEGTIEAWYKKKKMK